MTNLAFWKDAAERAVRTAAQALLSIWLVGDVAFSFYDIDWGQALGVAVGAALISILMSIAGGRTGDPNTATFIAPTTSSDEPTE